MTIQLIAITSLKIVFMWAAMRPGMVFYPLRLMIDSLLMQLPTTAMLYARKPLYDCLFCMSSVWGFLFTVHVAELSMAYLTMLLAVGGLNYLIQQLILPGDDD